MGEIRNNLPVRPTAMDRDTHRQDIILLNLANWQTGKPLFSHWIISLTGSFLKIFQGHAAARTLLSKVSKS